MAEDEAFPIVVVHYNGTFVPNPLVYFYPKRASVRDKDLKTMTFSDFISFLDKLTHKKCKDVYFCLPEVRLCEGLHTLQNDCDYSAFVEAANEKNKRIDVYVDDHHEPLFEWMELEHPLEEAEAEDEDVESLIADGVKCSHEEDEEVISTRRTINDHFLSKLCPVDNEDGHGEEHNAQPPIYPRHDETQQWDKMEPSVGMQYSNPSELKSALSNYAVAGGYDLYFEKNDKDRLLVKCCKGKTPKCPFRLWASWMTNHRTFQIKSLISDHSCSRAFKLGSIVTYKWIGKHFVNEILERPKISLRKMKAQISMKFNINVSVGQCRNAKKFALSEIEGSLKEHYARLWDYAEEIRRSNPGSHVEVYVEPQPDSSVIFERFYVAFKGVVDGWLDGCTKVIGVDGCFLKGICKGELLSAVGRDGNNHLYPIAWAVVNVENKSTWKWFLDNLMEDIGGENGSGITILSDGHKGLMEAVKERCPDAEHRLCARHILANFNKRFKGECYIKHFWKAVNATTQPKFVAAMDEIKAIDSRAFDYLIQRDPNCWSKAFFREGMDCDAVENGVSESFNSAIVDARRRPVITMLEDIRVWVMQRLYMMKQKGLNWDLAICPAIRKELEDMKIWQRFWHAIVSGYKQFEVIQGTSRYVVDLEQRECGCRGWQLTGIPCVHGMAAIASLNLDAEAFVSMSFTKASFLSSYEYTIHPLNDSSMWPHAPNLHTILPPKRRRLPGRPCVKRKRDRAENELSGNRRHTVSRSGIAQKCTICKQTGHKKGKCPSKSTTAAGPSSTQVPVSEEVPVTQVPVSEEVPVSQVPVSEEVHPNEDQAPVSQEVPMSEEVPVIPGVSGGRKRKVSERLTNIALKKVVVPKDGKGCSKEKPVELNE